MPATRHYGIYKSTQNEAHVITICRITTLPDTEVDTESQRRRDKIPLLPATTDGHLNACTLRRFMSTDELHCAQRASDTEF